MLRGDEPQIGPADALVTIVEFVDFTCDHCSSGTAALRQVLDENPDVRLVFKHHASPSSEAAPVAFAAHKQGRFWEMHDWLLAHGGDASKASTYAASLGLDMDTFLRSVASPEAAQALKSDRDAGTSANLQALPAYFVNGRQFVGAMSPSEWRRILDDERGAVEKALSERNAVESEQAVR